MICIFKFIYLLIMQGLHFMRDYIYATSAYNKYINILKIYFINCIYYVIEVMSEWVLEKDLAGIGCFWYKIECRSTSLTSYDYK